MLGTRVPAPSGRHHAGVCILSVYGENWLCGWLQTGDAVMHQSDLLHGVDVISGDRYSWVLCAATSTCNNEIFPVLVTHPSGP